MSYVGRGLDVEAVTGARQRLVVTKAASGATVTFDVPEWATSITILWREVTLR